MTTTFLASSHHLLICYAPMRARPQLRGETSSSWQVTQAMSSRVEQIRPRAMAASTRTHGLHRDAQEMRESTKSLTRSTFVHAIPTAWLLIYKATDRIHTKYPYHACPNASLAGHHTKREPDVLHLTASPASTSTSFITTVIH